MNAKFRFALDFGPFLAFFLAYHIAGLSAATALLIVASLLSLAVTYAKERRIAPMPLASAVVITFFGGLTLYLQDETFIKIKPTLINLLFSAILLIGYARGKAPLKFALGHALNLTHQGWRLLSLRWGLFFLFLAALNEVIWRHFSTDFWVSFKVFGMFSLTLLFTLSQLPLVMKHGSASDDQTQP